MMKSQGELFWFSDDKLFVDTNWSKQMVATGPGQWGTKSVRNREFGNTTQNWFDGDCVSWASAKLERRCAMFNGREKGRVAWSSHDKWVHGACRAVSSFIATVQPIIFGLAFLIVKLIQSQRIGEQHSDLQFASVL